STSTSTSMDSFTRALSFLRHLPFVLRHFHTTHSSLLARNLLISLLPALLAHNSSSRCFPPCDDFKFRSSSAYSTRLSFARRQEPGPGCALFGHGCVVAEKRRGRDAEHRAFDSGA